MPGRGDHEDPMAAIVTSSASRTSAEYLYKGSSAYDSSILINGPIYGDVNLPSPAEPSSASDALVSHNSHTGNRYFCVPRLVSPNYVGREELLHKLHQALSPDTPCGRQKRAVIYGLGGAGKTELSLEYIACFQQSFWGIFWVDLSSPQSALEGFQQIPQSPRPRGPEVVQRAKQWLASCRKTWLLILDNADDPELAIDAYIPPGNRGSVIITTRNENFRKYAPSSSFRLAQLEQDEAETLLLRTSGLDERQRGTLDLAWLTRRLGNLPLALIQAGSVIKVLDYSLSEYFELFATKRKDILDGGIAPDEGDHRLSVYATWDISVDAIKKSGKSLGKTISDDALELLSLLSLFDFHSVRIEIFTRAWKNCRVEGAFGLPEIPLLRTFLCCENPDGSWNDIRFRNSLARLKAFSLVQVDNIVRKISIHQLVHTWARDRLDRRHLVLYRKMALVTIGFASGSSVEAVSLGLIAHLHSCFSSAETGSNKNTDQNIKDVLSFSAENSNVGRKLSSAIARIWRMDQPLAATSVLGECYSNVVERMGTDHEESLSLLKALRDCHAELAEWEVALKMDTQLYEKYKRRFGGSHRSTLFTKYALAEDYMELGYSSKAASLLRELEESIIDDGSQPDDDDIQLRLRLQTAQASLLSELGNLSAAADRFHDAVALLSHRRDEVSRREMWYPFEVLSLMKLAALWNVRNCRRAALALYKEAFAKATELLGSDHPLTQEIHGVATYMHRASNPNTKGVAKTIQDSFSYRFPQLSMRSDLASSLIHPYLTRYGSDHPKTLGRTIVVARALISHEDDFEAGVALLQKTDGKLTRRHDKPIDFNIACLNGAIAGTYLSAASYGRSSTPGSRRYLLETALAKWQQTEEMFRYLFGSRNVHTARALFHEGITSFRLDDRDAACMVLAEAVDSLEGDEGSVVIHNYLYNLLLRKLFIYSSQVAYEKDGPLREVHRRIWIQSFRRDRLRYRSALTKCCTEISCCHEHCSFVDGPDFEGLSDLKTYWNYRLRAKKRQIQSTREQASIWPTTLWRTASLANSLYDVISPFQEVDDEWTGDFKTYTTLCEYMASIDPACFAHGVQTQLTWLRQLKSCYLTLKDFRKALDALCRLKHALQNVGGPQREIDDVDNQISEVRKSLLRQIHQQEKLSRGIFMTVAHDSLVFGITVTYFIATGFEWEPWFEDDEKEKSDPLRAAREIKDSVVEMVTPYGQRLLYSVKGWFWRRKEKVD